MSSLTDEENGSEDKTVTLKRSQIKSLEKRAQKADEWQAQAERAVRKLALRDAGIPNTPLGQLFEKAYDGPVEDVEAIRAKAVEYGVVTVTEQVPVEELAAHQRLAGIAAGTSSTKAIDYTEALKAARSEAEVMAIVHQDPHAFHLRED